MSVLVSVRASELKDGDCVVVKDDIVAVVKRVEPGPHKDAITVRLRRRPPLIVAWNAVVLKVSE